MTAYKLSDLKENIFCSKMRLLSQQGKFGPIQRYMFLRVQNPEFPIFNGFLFSKKRRKLIF